MTRILLLGGTTEARRMAEALAGTDTLYSYAGRTAVPWVPPVAVRTGGFGGAEGLGAFLRTGGFTHVIDATHPFADRISANAVAACTAMGVPLIALERPAWDVPAQRVPDMEGAVAALPEAPARVFLAIGRQNLPAFAHLRHRWLVRLVEDLPQPLPDADVVIDRGPFAVERDIAMLRAHGTEIVVAKNAGGEGARAKIDASVALGLRLILIDRPVLPPRPVMRTVEAAMRWLHDTPRGV
ncbi:cobalt-precorrin-6A reductase [Falsirhodobacter halotolerans]|uniref:cobalt-precorrin-6A reductase n=1 Tax=Falsirhodobacter halotolerans TaxID=1146892 RepID=UPI001FD5842D|nr:cobalt-precorrin-6A reductase [Falsirhodobacter halotolerans]MCJ8139016.1 cobalt-precorrin-6A reductase [Falsirhodobacter halotolerans]